MKLLIDDAHMEVIRRLYEFYPIDGVTTNPSILAKSGRPPYEALKEIRAFIGKDADHRDGDLYGDAGVSGGKKRSGVYGALYQPDR